jgi:hypothetical protein
MIKKKQQYHIILSASRMTDMPAWYPKQIIDQVKERLKKGHGIHTLVLWTKHPEALLKNPLHDFLLHLKKHHIQLYIQLTMTGMGQKKFGKQKNNKDFIPEPSAPLFEDSLSCLSELISLTENPLRIRLRIDPVIRIRDSNGDIYSNLPLFETILSKSSKKGIRDVSFSFLDAGVHKKVDARFKKIGCEILSPTMAEREKFKTWANKLEDKYQVRIHACCVEGFPESKCIDGELLQKLHDLHLPANQKQPRSRPTCGCTYSVDIGGWPPKICPTGCFYCYARPDYLVSS